MPQTLYQPLAIIPEGVTHTNGGGGGGGGAAAAADDDDDLDLNICYKLAS